MKRNFIYPVCYPDFSKNRVAMLSFQMNEGTRFLKIVMLICFILSLLPLQSNAQNVTIYNTENSGLPDNEVTSIAIDAHGTKWFGTSDGQVAKYDGINWTVYDNTNSALPANYPITSIAIDKENNKWIGTYLIYSTPNDLVVGTDGGLIKFDDTNWIIFNNTNSGLPNNSIKAITIDSDGSKWIATRNGLAKFDNVNWMVFNNSNSGLPTNEVTAIAIDELGNKWIGTSEGAIAKFNGTNWTVFDNSNSTLSKINEINSIAIDDDGNKWFGGTSDWAWGLDGGGLAFFDDNNWSFYSSANSQLPYNSVTAIATDKLGNKWMGTYLPELYFFGSIVKLDGDNWVIFEESNSILPVDYIHSIVVDRSNNKWFGTWQNGVVVFNENGIKTGIDDKSSTKANDFRLYPNPAKDFITLDGSVSGTLEIFNASGAILLNSKVQEVLTKVDISALPDGFYSARLTTKDEVNTLKFIKQ